MNVNRDEEATEPDAPSSRVSWEQSLRSPVRRLVRVHAVERQVDRVSAKKGAVNEREVRGIVDVRRDSVKVVVVYAWVHANEPQVVLPYLQVHPHDTPLVRTYRHAERDKLDAVANNLPERRLVGRIRRYAFSSVPSCVQLVSNNRRVVRHNMPSEAVYGPVRANERRAVATYLSLLAVRASVAPLYLSSVAAKPSFVSTYRSLASVNSHVVPTYLFAVATKPSVVRLYSSSVAIDPSVDVPYRSALALNPSVMRMYVSPIVIHEACVPMHLSSEPVRARAVGTNPLVARVEPSVQTHKACSVRTFASMGRHRGRARTMQRALLETEPHVGSDLSKNAMHSPGTMRSSGHVARLHHRRLAVSLYLRGAAASFFALKASD